MPFASPVVLELDTRWQCLVKLPLLLHWLCFYFDSKGPWTLLSLLSSASHFLHLCTKSCSSQTKICCHGAHSWDAVTHWCEAVNITEAKYRLFIWLLFIWSHPKHDFLHPSRVYAPSASLYTNYEIRKRNGRLYTQQPLRSVRLPFVLLPGAVADSR